MATTSTRPEFACEIVPEGVIAARRQAGSSALAAAAFAAFGPGGPAGTFAPYIDKDAPRVGLPGVQTGGAGERDAVVAAMRRALESVGGRSGVLTLVIPDTAVRVLILDFDSLPAKAADAIPLLRFRLKKMLPFDVDDAQVSYQPLHASTGARARVAVLPNPVLREYEAVVREAGFEPGIVLPSTLACLGMVAASGAALLVHCSTQSVTTAIVNGEELLLHRSQELPWSQEKLAQTMNAAADSAPENLEAEKPIAVIETASLSNTEPAEEVSAARYPEAHVDHILQVQDDLGEVLPADGTLYPGIEPGDGGDEPQVAWGNPWPEAVAAPANEPLTPALAEPGPEQPAELQVDSAAATPGSVQTELHDAVFVAAAYYEDAVGKIPSPILVSGAMDARTWQSVLGDATLTLRDLVALEDMGTATATGFSRAQLGAVCGALRG